MDIRNWIADSEFWIASVIVVAACNISHAANEANLRPTVKLRPDNIKVWSDHRKPDAKPIFVELLDHQTDPAETKNVAGAHPGLVRQLLRQMNDGWKTARQEVR